MPSINQSINRLLSCLNLTSHTHTFPIPHSNQTNQHKGTSRRQGPYDAVEWAEVRGHTEMAALLRGRIAQLQQEQEQEQEGKGEGKGAQAAVGGGGGGGSAPQSRPVVREPEPGVEEQQEKQRDATEDGTEDGGGGGKGEEAETAPMTPAALSPPLPTPPRPTMPVPCFGMTSPGWTPVPAAATAAATAAALASFMGGAGMGPPAPGAWGARW